LGTLVDQILLTPLWQLPPDGGSAGKSSYG
jgi:hypothetical protein